MQNSFSIDCILLVSVSACVGMCIRYEVYILSFVKVIAKVHEINSLCQSQTVFSRIARA